MLYLADQNLAFGVALDAGQVAQIEYCYQAVKAPRIREAATRLAAQTCEGGWTREEYLWSRRGRLPEPRSGPGPLVSRSENQREDFNFEYRPASTSARGVSGTGAFLTEAFNIFLFGPPGIGKT